ncbi:MAG: ATP-binding protein [Candidatus Brocadia sp.]|nr:ATP-binding protein [Candidatus Brocadia sp.]
MSELTADSQSAIDTKVAYATSWDHLSDELKRLDLLIHLQVIKQRNSQLTNPLDQFKGMVLSEQEIAVLLAGDDSQLAVRGRHGSPLKSADDSVTRSLGDALCQLESQIEKRREANLKEVIYLSLPHLTQLFHLTPFEEQCLLICLAPEVDRKYEKLYAYLQDDVTRKKPSVDLILNLLCNTMQEKLAARLAFDPQSPLLKYRLLEITNSLQEGPVPLLSRLLKLDDRIVNFLLGFGQIDARLGHIARLVSPRNALDQAVVSEDILNRMRGFVRSHFSETRSARQNVVFYFYGPYGSGKQPLAEVVCHDLGLPLIIADAEKILGWQLPFDETMWLLGREAVLQPAILYLENFEHLLTDDSKYQSQVKLLLEVTQTFSRLTFLAGSRSWKPQGLLSKHTLSEPDEPLFIDIELPIPNYEGRKHVWENSLNGHYQLASDVDIGALAGKFRFTPGQIQDALVTAQNLTCWRSPEDRQITMTDLYAACRAQSNQKLSTLARKIEPRYTWDDIVLPSDQLAQLREICNQATYRHIVYGEWGFDRKLSLGKGLNALFSGPSGTGKTMAAGIIAHELGLDLYKIDLSQVVSKYIGETEKNLDKIFTEAQTSNAILFFDEADALFGKRSEVKDAHDRYANIEIGYLLQKMEEYDGIAILATNLRQNMDEAFVRRIQIIVEFPFPDEEHRGRIWKVVFPGEAPLGNDIDFSVLAREIKLPGGNIKNIALAAAFFAAEDGGVIRMPYLVQAARREYQKLGRIWNEAGWSI